MRIREVKKTPSKPRDPNAKAMQDLRKSGAAGSHGDKTKEIPRKAKHKNKGLQVEDAHSENKPKKKIDADMKLPNGKKMVFQADDDKYTRGLVITSNADGSYDSYYWAGSPDKPMPIEIKIDGKSVDKEAKKIHWAYHPKMKETATPGSTSAGNIATVANPHIANSKAKPKKQKPTDNALDNKSHGLFGQPLKRLNNSKEVTMDKSKELNEDLADLASKAEQDHEVQMARAQLYKIAKYSIKLHDMLKGVSEQEGLEGWVQSKITKAADYMGAVYHNMDYEMKFDEVTEGKGKATCGCKDDCGHCGGDHTMAEVGKECSCCGNKIKEIKNEAPVDKKKEKKAKDYKESLANRLAENLNLKKKTDQDTDESGIMYRAGVKKYGKDGMKKIQSAAGKGASAEEIGKIKDKHNKKKKESYGSLEESVGKSITEEEFDTLAEKKDACYHKVKSRYKVWPSAYASGALVQCRKKGAANWGKSKK